MTKSISEWLKKELSRHFTILLVPHSRFKPLRITFTVSFLLFLFVLWTGVTIWAGYLSSKHIDYWRVKAEHNLLRLRMALLAKQLNESREYLDQVKENDTRIRELLELKTKKAIITGGGVSETAPSSSQNEEVQSTLGAGGPTPRESALLDQLLNGKLEISPENLYEQTRKIKEISRIRLQSISEIMENINYQRALYSSTPNTHPLSGGGRITSGYGFRLHPVYGSFEFHSGIDIAAERDTPVVTTASGKVLFTGWVEGYGKLVIVDHGFNYSTYYGHLNKILCKQGDRVERGKIIGLVGDTGTSTGYHLHYEVRFNGKTVNAAKYLDPDNYFKNSKVVLTSIR